MMSYNFTDHYDKTFLLKNMMGPNAMRIAEELDASLNICPDMRLLDLGCGCGLSTIYYAENYPVDIIAADLWISPTDNYRRFVERGIDKRVTPIHIDATESLPFAERYFDLLISIDAYHYFGCDEMMLKKLTPHIKSGGKIAVVVPGLKKDFNDDIPDELKPFWQENMNLFSCDWWQTLWQKEAGIKIDCCREMDCCEAAWADWLACPDPYAQNDIKMMAAEGGNYFNLVMIIATAL